MMITATTTPKFPRLADVLLASDEGDIYVQDKAGIYPDSQAYQIVFTGESIPHGLQLLIARDVLIEQQAAFFDRLPEQSPEEAETTDWDAVADDLFTFLAERGVFSHID